MVWYNCKTRHDLENSNYILLKRLFVLKCHNTINMFNLKLLFHVLNMEAIISYLCKIATLQKELTYGEWCIATNTLWLLST